VIEGVLVVWAIASAAQGTAANTRNPSATVVGDTVSVAERVVTASKVYHQVATHFPELSPAEFDKTFASYIADITRAGDDRREFDLRTMALIASLHDGHTWFYDDWLAQAHGQPIGFTAYPLDGRWIVVRSQIALIHTGDVVLAIDGETIATFFDRQRRYISASSERDAATSLFDTPALFPDRFRVHLDDGRDVLVDRAHDVKRATPNAVEGHWLVPNEIGYLRLSSFHGLDVQGSASTFEHQFHAATTMVLDLRGNMGGGSPRALQQELMDRPYPSWSESSTIQGGPMLRGYDVAHPGTMHVTTGESTITPRGPSYSGRLIILIDRGCTCACEDFVMPFKATGRAVLIGETTAGTFSFTERTQFANGMMLNVSAVRHRFPDGSRFEGVGIAPDIAVVPTAADLRAARDVVLERALRAAREPR
jgi:carboxyl-terminal processing protease